MKFNKKNVKKVLKLQKLSIVLITFFSLFCFNLGAETISMTIEKAKEYRKTLCSESERFMGCPYVYGAHGPDKFDCSGLIYYIAKEQFKIRLPRTARGMYEFADPVPEDKKEPGDLVFFKTTNSGLVTHVGVYVGDNNFISALSDGPKRGVVLSSLSEKYWAKRYVETRRFLPATLTIENFEDSAEYDVDALLDTLNKIQNKEITVQEEKPQNTKQNSNNQNNQNNNNNKTNTPSKNEKTPAKPKDEIIYEEVVKPVSSIIRNSLEKTPLLSSADIVNKLNSVVYNTEQTDELSLQ